jgi:ribosomal protein S18 acetylase RimI-like enzyme
MAVLQLDPTDATHVQQFSEIRLRALQTDPAAFGSTYERELAFDEAAWRGRLAGFAGHPGTVFVVDATVATSTTGATTNELVAPLLGVVGVGLPERTDAALWGMWIAPEGRRRGVAAQLLETAEAWAVHSGAQTVTLWVHRSNDGAQALYEGRGYELVGPDDLPADVPDSCSDEICMRARLGST